MMSESKTPAIHHPAFQGRIGIARREITPPVGIYSRMWGSAQHDLAEDIHRPLTATMLTIQPFGGGRPFFLCSLDLGWWRSPEDEQWFRVPILKALSIDESQLLIHLSHTHAGPSISLQARNKPGGDKIEPYLLAVRQAVIDAARQALASAASSTLDWNVGRCNLACIRDQPNPDGKGVIVGYAPQAAADDTLLIGRVTDESGRIRATLVNYACHPTTLAWANRALSPDYVGAMREVVEQATQNAPCVFINGAAGDLAPRQQYTDNLEVADQNGLQLGYAVLATLANMLPPCKSLRYHGIERSTAALGCWRLFDEPVDHSWAGALIKLNLPLQRSHTEDESIRQLASLGDRVAVECLERVNHMWGGLQDAQHAAVPIWLWRLGNTLVVGLPFEMHSPFQIALRQRLPNHAVIVANLVNGSNGYLPPKEDFEKHTYQCSKSLFDVGAHETVTSACIESLEKLIVTNDATIAMAGPHFATLPHETTSKR